MIPDKMCVGSLYSVEAGLKLVQLLNELAAVVIHFDSWAKEIKVLIIPKIENVIFSFIVL